MSLKVRRNSIWMHAANWIKVGVEYTFIPLHAGFFAGPVSFQAAVREGTLTDLAPTSGSDCPGRPRGQLWPCGRVSFSTGALGPTVNAFCTLGT